MKIASLAEIKNKLSFYINSARESPVIITRNGKPVAAIITIQDEDDLDSLMLAHSPRFQKLLADADERVRRTGGIPLAEVKRRLAARPRIGKGDSAV
jgi:prevent-host-death family protein